MANASLSTLNKIVFFMLMKLKSTFFKGWKKNLANVRHTKMWLLHINSVMSSLKIMINYCIVRENFFYKIYDSILSFASLLT